VNFRKILSNSWQQTVLPKFLVRIRGHISLRCYYLPPAVPHWKAQFGKLCVSEVVAGILTARPPKYSVIVDLDHKIRDIELPQYALIPPRDGAP
jgi:hypothetical protein